MEEKDKQFRQTWYHFGRNVEFLEWYIKQVVRKTSEKTRSHRNVLVEVALSDADYSLRKLHDRVVNQVGKEVNYLTAMRECNRIHEQVKRADNLI